MPSNHLILCCPLLLLPSIFPSIRVFSNDPALRSRWPKYWSFSFSISPSNEHSGLIFFRIDWFDLLAVQGTLNSLLQYQFWKHQFFGIQPSFCPTLTSICDYGKSYSFDYDPFLAKWCLCFLIFGLDLSKLFFKKQTSFNFMAAVTIHSDYWSNKLCCYPIQG